MRTIPANRVTTEPTVEPVSIAEVKLNAYIVSDTSYDDFIDDQLIPTARRTVEKIANRSLITQTRKQYYDDLYTQMFMRFSPVQSISSITYKDSNADTQSLSSSLYTLDSQSYPARIVEAYNQTYPTAICDTNSVTVTAVCGYGDTAADVPIIYRRAIILLCTHWFNNRSSIACGQVDGDIMQTLETMLAVEGATVEYA